MSALITAYLADAGGAAVATILADSGKGFDLVTLGRNIVNGLTFGSIYALVALSIVLIYKSSDVVNFGTAEMGMFATFVCFSSLSVLVGRVGNNPLPETIGLGNYLLAIVATLVFAGLLGLMIERILLRPLSKAPVLSQVMVTIGLGVFLFGIASFIWKADNKPFSELDAVKSANIRINVDNAFISITGEMITAMLIGAFLSLLLYLFFKFTLVGTAMRAMAQNPTTAKLMGVNVGFLTGLTWMIAMMLLAIAGVLVAPKISLSPLMMANVAVLSFAGAVLGGMTSLVGAVVGGLLVGIIDNLVGFYLPDGLRSMLAFLIIVVVLTFRPNGLLGKVVRKKV
ncbi:branched-chain amino acid ABC transporter permease [Candidatus Chlorohelix sp.]|uniref:branched-chain amino acid ABC transporter permease n=1 Tax=Candidatus Chlorohelix sp. TaxID=3139201 RepID=UPI00302F8DB8